MIIQFQIYTKPITDAFAGIGQEYLIVEQDTILVHGRGWDDPTVFDIFFDAHLLSLHINQRGKGWRKLTGFALENAQGWAGDVVWYAKVTQ